jgi:aryl-alcohol dehydrogenase-like predicted oxidoreductase
MSFTGVALGCGNFGGIGSAPEFFGQGIDDETSFAIMDTAWARGLRWFDTADAYGGGKSEELIGQWRSARKPADLVLTTKVFHSTRGEADDTGLAPDRIRRQLEGSLARLGIERLDLYLAHEPDPSVPVADTVAAFESLRDEGLIAEWGLSNYDAAGIREALAVAQPALVQNSFSLLERGDERDVIPLCVERGIDYVPYGPLSGGWLTGKYRRDEAFPDGSRMTMRPGPYEHLRTDAVFDGLDRLREEADVRGVDMATLAFAWVLAHPGVSGAVCGPMRPEHLEPVLAARDLTLTESDHRQIGGLFA